MRDYEDRWRAFCGDRQNMTLKVPLRDGVVYYEPAGIVNPVVFSTPTTACEDGTMNTVDVSSHACVFPRWIPADKWDTTDREPEMIRTHIHGKWISGPVRDVHGVGPAVVLNWECHTNPDGSTCLIPMGWDWSKGEPPIKEGSHRPPPT